LGKKAGRTEILQSYNMSKQCKYQHSQHDTQQEAIQIDTRRGSGSCQKYDSRAGRIPTFINGYTDPQNWRDRKRLNSDGVLNALKTTDKSEKKEVNRNTVGEESMIEKPPCKILQKENPKHLPLQPNLHNVNRSVFRHRIIIVGDSHMRSCSNEVKQKVGCGFEVLGIVKPGASTEAIINTVTKDIGKFTYKDVVVVWTGTWDVAKNEPKKGLHHIINCEKPRTNKFYYDDCTT
jgi:hypothetical protein